MTQAELRDTLACMKLSRRQLAGLCGVNPTTVYRWQRAPGTPGALPVPHYVHTILRLLREYDKHTEAVLAGKLVEAE